MSFRQTGRPAPRDGEITTVDVDGATIAVARVDGALYAFQDECTHQRCSLSTGDLEGATVVCPCHMGQFDLASGEVVDGPPPTPLRTFGVRDVGGHVELET